MALRWAAPLSLLSPLLVLAALLLGLTAAQNETPVLWTIYPDHGPRTGRTPVFIRGLNLGQSQEDIEELIVGGFSCIGSLVYEGPHSIMCQATPHNTLAKGQEEEEGSLSPRSLSAGWHSARFGAPLGAGPEEGEGEGEREQPLSAVTPVPRGTRGEVRIRTRSGGSSASNLTFTFFDSCFMMTTLSECEKAGKYGSCRWCKFSTKCAENYESCNEGCSTPFLKMTCGELVGMIIASVFLLCAVIFILVILITLYFPQRSQPTKVEDVKDDAINGSKNRRRRRRSSESKWSKATGEEREGGEPSRRSKAAAGGAGAEGEDEDEDDEEEEYSEDDPLVASGLSERFLRHQIAIENAHKKLAGTKSFTSFY